MRAYVRSFDEVLLVGLFLAGAQIADALLTLIGVHRFGIAAEGNAILKALMLQFGSVPTLAVSKIIAVLLIIVLTLAAKRIFWIKNAMGVVSIVYLFAAIFPWAYLLASRA